jgi:O-methyltransferase
MLWAGRRLALGRLAEAGEMFDRVSAKLDAIDAHTRQLTGPRSGSMGSLIDYQIETAQYYMKTAMGDIAPGFNALYQRCKGHTIASVEQLYAVNTAIDHIIRCDIPGDIVDCGAGRGGTAMMAALTLSGLEQLDRRLVLLDSFDELPASASNGQSADDRVGEVSRLLATTGYPNARIDIVSGMVERTASTLAVERIAFLRVDTESYTAVKAVLETLSPRLQAGGVLLVNDTSTLLGPRQALTEFFSKGRQSPLFHRIDYCTRVASWPG